MGEGRHVWARFETLALIDIWKEKFSLLRSQRRTAHVHEEIRQALAALNIHKSIRQIVVKIDNMTQKYRKTKNAGKKNPTWDYFKRLDSFMGSQNRNRIIKDGNESDINESSDVVGTNSNPSQCSTIAISNIQGSETQNESDTDSNTNGISTFSFVSNYQDKLLRILSNQLEIQKQSLAVQEKLIALMKNMSNCSPESQPLKIEVD